MAVNEARGETSVRIGDADVVFVLTVGALARIESAMGVHSMQALFARLAEPGINDMLAVIEALTEGKVVRADLERLPLTALGPIVAGVHKAMLAAFPESERKNGDAGSAPMRSPGTNGSASRSGLLA